MECKDGRYDHNVDKLYGLIENIVECKEEYQQTLEEIQNQINRKHSGM